MPHYGALLDYHFTTESADDVRGSAIYGPNDEKLGKIDDVIFDHSTGRIHYAVVDTGGWLKSKKFIVPSERLRTSPEHKDDFMVGLTKAQIESFPPYDEKTLESEQKWADYETRYRSAWSGIPSQPETDVIGEGRRSSNAEVIGEGRSPKAEVIGRGRRWSNFEDRLRRERALVVERCSICGPHRERKVS